ncbi:MAG: PQQ-binding-like beta-propeller repeat protein [Euryarchaeota archaeon]
MDLRPLLLAALVLLTLPAVNASAEPGAFEETYTLDWTYDFGGSYITTAPLFVDQQLFVRTSASWGGDNSPTLAAFSLDGEPLWSHTNSNSTHHDMAPLLHVAEGEGSCGSWPDMLIIGWSDGQIEARSTEDGALIWAHQSEPIIWGITGAMAVDEDRIVAPTRSGVVALCASNGMLEMEAQTGLGWRNGVTIGAEEYFLGDESGLLWGVTRDGVVRSIDLGEGKIRHAPLMTTAGLFVQVQGVPFSIVHLIDVDDFTSKSTLRTGTSPAVPIMYDSFVLSADSEAIRLFSCEVSCEETSQVSFRSNGEIGVLGEGQFSLPFNGLERGWGLVNVSSSGGLMLEEFTTGADGYATSAPGTLTYEETTYLAFGSDESVVYVYTANQAPADESIEVDQMEFDWFVQGMTFLLFLSLGAAGVQFLRNKGTSVLRFLSIYLLIIALLIVDQVAVQWSQFIQENTPDADAQEVWDPSWNESWRGTQIVSITIEGELHSVGGLEGYTNAYELTKAACEELGLEIRVESTSLGIYVVAFEGVTGEGWEYTVDGRLATLAADSAMLDAASIVQWYPVEAR